MDNELVNEARKYLNWLESEAGEHSGFYQDWHERDADAHLFRIGVTNGWYFVIDEFGDEEYVSENFIETAFFLAQEVA